jgi:hypothetical protein
MLNKIKIAFLLMLVCLEVEAIGMQSTSDVKASIDRTIAYLEQAVAAFEKGDQSKTIELLMEAKQVQKTFSSANGKLSMTKAKATHQLGQARSSFNEGDTNSGATAMKEALAGFKELKEQYNALH